MTLEGLYGRAPIPVQHAFATGYGLRELPRRHAGRFRRELAGLDARQWWDGERLAADQSSRLRSMITWCAARVPHYRDLFAELRLDPRDIRTPEDLAVLPILDKETVRANPERFLPDEPRPRLIAQSTGGTTGVPIRYWATWAAVQTNYATYEARHRGWAGAKFGQRMASFHGKPVVPAGQVGGPYWRRNLAFNQLYFSVYHLNAASLPSYVDQLERFDPEVVAGYTSAVHRVARHILERGDVGRVRPHALLLSSEMLTPEARSDIETAFGCRATDGYSLGELVAFISECPHGELHISPEYGVIELVDSEVSGSGSGDSATSGSVASKELIATTLINRGMPLLRYRTNDLAVAAPPGPSLCGRGLPRVEQLIGRVDDVVHTPDGGMVGAGAIVLAFQSVPHLRRAQVRQETVEEVTVLLEVTDEFGATDLAFCDGELRSRLGPDIGFRFERVDQIPRTSGGKERVIISKLGGVS